MLCTCTRRLFLTPTEPLSSSSGRDTPFPRLAFRTVLQHTHQSHSTVETASLDLPRGLHCNRRRRWGDGGIARASVPRPQRGLRAIFQTLLDAVDACDRRARRIVQKLRRHRGSGGGRGLREILPFAPAIEVDERLHTAPFHDLTLKPDEVHGL